MKIIEKWNEVDRRQAGAGMQVLYELGGYRIAVSDASYMPGGLSITAYPINRDSYSTWCKRTESSSGSSRA